MKTFLEIGACDFDTCAPLAKNGWSGVMVEPVKELADNLVKMTHGLDVKIENSVISDYDGMIEFHVSEGNDWVRGISSVASTNHKGERMFDIDNSYNKRYLKETRQLECMTLDSLIDKYNLTEIDFLKMDVEGHETNIMESYSWKIKPSFIKMEHQHIDDINMKRILEEQGYIVWTEDRDIYAVR